MLKITGFILMERVALEQYCSLKHLWRGNDFRLFGS